MVPLSWYVWNQKSGLKSQIVPQGMNWACTQIFQITQLQRTRDTMPDQLWACCSWMLVSWTPCTSFTQCAAEVWNGKQKIQIHNVVVKNFKQPVMCMLVTIAPFFQSSPISELLRSTSTCEGIVPLFVFSWNTFLSFCPNWYSMQTTHNQWKQALWRGGGCLDGL